MKSNKGMGYIKVIIIIIIMAIFAGSGVYFLKLKRNEIHIETIKTNMLLIEWKVKEYEELKKTKGEDAKYYGKTIQEMKEDSLIKVFLSKGVIKEEEYGEYYVLTNDDLGEFGLEVSNEDNSYYIINYKTDDIIISEGVDYGSKKILYKLSDMEKEKNKGNIANEVINNT